MTEPIPTWQLLPASLSIFNQVIPVKRQDGDEDAAIIRLAMEALENIETVLRLWPYPHFKLDNLQMLRLALSAQRTTEEYDGQ